MNIFFVIFSIIAILQAVFASHEGRSGDVVVNSREAEHRSTILEKLSKLQSGEGESCGNCLRRKREVDEIDDTRKKDKNSIVSSEEKPEVDNLPRKKRSIASSEEKQSIQPQFCDDGPLSCPWLH